MTEMGNKEEGKLIIPSIEEQMFTWVLLQHGRMWDGMSVMKMKLSKRVN